MGISKSHRYVSLIGPLTPGLAERRVLSEAMSAAEYEGWPLAVAKRVEPRASSRERVHTTEERTHHG
jgi:hypothetical protein